MLPSAMTTSIPASSSTLTPPPSTRGLGSRKPTTTRLACARTREVAQGGVFPLWQHGSSVTYAVTPENSEADDSLLSIWRLKHPPKSFPGPPSSMYTDKSGSILAVSFPTTASAAATPSGTCPAASSNAKTSA